MLVMKALRPLSLSSICLAVLLSTASAHACRNPPQPRLKTEQLTLETLRGVTEFTVELAATAEEKACGLMKRPRLAAFQGMLFRQTPPGPAYFWMKNTPAPLDMIFIDAEGHIIHVIEHATPYSTTARGTDLPTTGILELRAGMANRLAIELGDRVTHRWFKPAK